MDNNLILIVGILLMAAGAGAFVLAGRPVNKIVADSPAEVVSSERYMKLVFLLGGFLTFIPGVFLMAISLSFMMTGSTL